MDLREAAYGPTPVGCRRLWSLLVNVPPRDSAIARAISPDGSQWTNTEELLAGLCELVDHGNRLFFMANAKKGTQAPKPVRIPRPTETTQEPRKQATRKEMVAFFGSRNGKG